MQVTCRNTVYSPRKGEVLFLEGHTYDCTILSSFITTHNEQSRPHILLDRNNPKGWEWFQEHFE